MSNNAITYAIECIKFMRENQKYIEIGIKKYKEKFDVSIKYINHILGCNIFVTNLEELEKIIDKLDFEDYMDVIEKIGILREDLIAIILEEKNPINARLNKYLEEER